MKSGAACDFHWMHGVRVDRRLLLQTPTLAALPGTAMSPEARQIATATARTTYVALG